MSALSAVESASAAVEAATDDLRRAVVVAVSAGSPITAVAVAAKITRPTVYAWVKASRDFS